jgi:hypothetical protein
MPFSVPGKNPVGAHVQKITRNVFMNYVSRFCGNRLVIVGQNTESSHDWNWYHELSEDLWNWICCIQLQDEICLVVHLKLNYQAFNYFNISHTKTVLTYIVVYCYVVNSVLFCHFVCYLETWFTDTTSYSRNYCKLSNIIAIQLL